MKTTRRRLTDAQRLQALLFKQMVCANPCLMCGATAGHLTAAHIVPAQTLRRHGYGDKVYDPRSAICLCWEPCHTDHDGYRQRVPRWLLPAESVGWLQALGFGWYLARHYPETA